MGHLTDNDMYSCGETQAITHSVLPVMSVIQCSPARLAIPPGVVRGAYDCCEDAMKKKAKLSHRKPKCIFFSVMSCGNSPGDATAGDVKQGIWQKLGF